MKPIAVKISDRFATEMFLKYIESIDVCWHDENLRSDLSKKYWFGITCNMVNHPINNGSLNENKLKRWLHSDPQLLTAEQAKIFILPNEWDFFKEYLTNYISFFTLVRQIPKHGQWWRFEDGSIGYVVYANDKKIRYLVEDEIAECEILDLVYPAKKIEIKEHLFMAAKKHYEKGERLNRFFEDNNPKWENDILFYPSKMQYTNETKYTNGLEIDGHYIYADEIGWASKVSEPIKRKLKERGFILYIDKFYRPSPSLNNISLKLDNRSATIKVFYNYENSRPILLTNFSYSNLDKFILWYNLFCGVYA